MKLVFRTQAYLADLDAIEAYIARTSPQAASKMWFHIDDQVSKLADPNFPRRPGMVKYTKELVAHANYIVIIDEDETSVTALSVVHARRQYP